MTRKKFGRILGGLLVAVLYLVLFAGFLTVSYSAAFVLVLGTAACLIIASLFPPWFSRSVLLAVGVIALLLAGASAISTHFGISIGVTPIGMTGYDANVSLAPNSNDPNRFVLDETLDWVDVYKKPIDQPPFTYSRIIEAKRVGVFIHEVDFTPLAGNARVLFKGPYPFLRFSKGKGRHFDMGICTEPCTNTAVMLTLPVDSFWQANALTTVQSMPFGDTETVTWTLRNIDRPVKFIYIDPEWRRFRGILGSYYSATSYGDLFVIALSCLLSAALVGSVPPWMLGVVALIWGFRKRMWPMIKSLFSRKVPASGSQQQSAAQSATPSPRPKKSPPAKSNRRNKKRKRK